ncbi:chaplin [Streptomyces sp. NPDC059525]|uniref:chaplin n=1 Tax=Streptomyces sp. NPDC059525 TaxID=3346857 RepID=UPI00368BD22A
MAGVRGGPAVTLAAGAVAVASASVASADAGAQAVTAGSSGAGSSGVSSSGVGPGNLIQVPPHIPVNACGNTASVTGLLNPSFGNTCINA